MKELVNLTPKRTQAIVREGLVWKHLVFPENPRSLKGCNSNCGRWEQNRLGDRQTGLLVFAHLSLSMTTPPSLPGTSAAPPARSPAEREQPGNSLTMLERNRASSERNYVPMFTPKDSCIFLLA